MKKIAILFSLAVLAGCSSEPGPTPASQVLDGAWELMTIESKAEVCAVWILDPYFAMDAFYQSYDGDIYLSETDMRTFFDKECK